MRSYFYFMAQVCPLVKAAGSCASITKNRTITITRGREMTEKYY